MLLEIRTLDLPAKRYNSWLLEIKIDLNFSLNRKENGAIHSNSGGEFRKSDII
jgi:hypothetical protein